MSRHIGPKISRDRLMIYLDTNNGRSYSNGSTSFIDLTNQNNGIIRNGPVFDAANNELVFNGINNYVEFSSTSRKWSWAPVGSTGYTTISLEIWIKTTDTGWLVSKPWNGSGGYNYGLTATEWRTQLSTYHSLSFPTIADGTWKHIVAIANTTQKAVYVNGRQVAGWTNHNEASDVVSGGDSNISMCVLTLYPYGTGAWSQPTHAINGSLGMFRFYGRQLTDGEIVQHFAAHRGRFGV